MNAPVRIALGAGLLGITAAVLGRRRRDRDVTADRAHVTRSVTIYREPEALFAFFRDPANVPQFFHGVSHVEVRDEKWQRWTFAAGGRTAVVDVDIVDVTPPQRLEFRLHAGPFTGSASFTLAPAPGNRGTEARLAIGLTGPIVKAAAAFARVFGASPAQIAKESLRNLKALTEAGEIPKAVRD